ncbi:MAG: tRNA pseudouridine(38-40) synthase TruA [Thermoplasmata archaeon]|nr:MAG: tRNA pseudouridine(38-40) synthase TruA [Thermoplasmata archaeon]
MRRYALKVFYNGKNFYGSQIQPNVRTVEGELRKALGKFCEFYDFKGAARTDRGVSALGNVFALTTEFKLQPRIINAHLPEDIFVLGLREVNLDFNPMKEAKERIYKYFLVDDEYDLDKIKKASKIIEGKHSFHNFTISNENPIRTINYIEVEKKNGIIILTFSGKSFLWQMVRRLTTALKLVGKGELTIKDLKNLFKKEINKKIKASEPEFLILWDIKYDFKFKCENFSLNRFIEHLKREICILKMKEEILDFCLSNISCP